MGVYFCIPKEVVQNLQTQIPGLENELQQAINTLKKLQSITGTLGPNSAGQLDLNALAAMAGNQNLVENGKAHGSNAAHGSSVHDSAHGSSSLGSHQTTDSAVTPKKTHILAAGETFGRYQFLDNLAKVPWEQSILPTTLNCIVMLHSRLHSLETSL